VNSCRLRLKFSLLTQPCNVLLRGPSYDATMLEPIEPEAPGRLVAGPIVCPICWDHALERIEGIRLSTRTVDEHAIGKVSLYRCSHWHLFALFEREL